MEKLYYLFYDLIKTQRKNDQSFFNSYIGFTFLEFMNLATIFKIVNNVSKFVIPKNAAIYGGLMVFGIILIYNYFFLWLKKDHIILKYQKQEDKSGKWLVWSYIILSFVCFFSV
jgi:hypothetical protein